MAEKKTDVRKGKSIASMVLGICSVVFCWLGVISLIAGIVALILAGFQLKKKEGKGFAIAGLVTGIIGTILSLIYTILWLVAIAGYFGIS